MIPRNRSDSDRSSRSVADQPNLASLEYSSVLREQLLTSEHKEISLVSSLSCNTVTARPRLDQHLEEDKYQEQKGLVKRVNPTFP